MQRLLFTRVLHYTHLTFMPLLVNDANQSGFIYIFKIIIQTRIFTQAASKPITAGKFTMYFHLESSTGYNCYQNNQQENLVFHTKDGTMAKTLSLPARKRSLKKTAIRHSIVP